MSCPALMGERPSMNDHSDRGPVEGATQERTAAGAGDLAGQRTRYLLWVVALVAASLVLRLCFATFLSFVPRSDAREYHELAGAILHEGSFPSALRSPGYPAFIAGIWAVFGEALLPVYVIQAILSAAAVWVILRLGLDMFGWRNRWAVFAAAAAIGLSAEIASYSGILLMASIAMLMVPLAALLCYRALNRDLRYAVPLGCVWPS